MKKIAVQKIFWDAFEMAISTQANRLARDIAATLGQDPVPLLSQIRNEKVGVYLFEGTEPNEDPIEMRCPHVSSIPSKTQWKVACMEPVLWSENPVERTGLCLHHSFHPEPMNPGWKKFLEWRDGHTRFYICIEDGTVYNDEGELCGRYLNKKMTLFSS